MTFRTAAAQELPARIGRLQYTATPGGRSSKNLPV